MRNGGPGMIRTLLDRLLAARARRDREQRFSERWRIADTEMHDIESAIFRVPLEPRDAERRSPGRRTAVPSR
jgi:hypothetical protein